MQILSIKRSSLGPKSQVEIKFSKQFNYQIESIDERMVLLKGRLLRKQCNLIKPIIKGYKLCRRADMFGYIYQKLCLPRKRKKNATF